MLPNQARLFQQYMVDELGQSPRTARTYIQSVRRLERFCGKELGDITVEDGRRFVRESDYATGTKALVIAAWKSMHRYGALEGWWQLNGVVAMRAPKGRRKRGLSIPFADVPQVLAACKLPTDYRLVYLGLYAGLRVREATFVRESHWAHGMLLVKEGKGAKERVVPVHPELERVKLVILATEPVGNSTLQEACQRVRERAGIYFPTHGLRRTFSRMLESREVPHDVIAALLGHSPDITSFYTGVSERRMVEAIRRIDYGGTDEDTGTD